jgi:hypothetical protein
MPFIGNQPAEKYSAFQKQDFTTSATTSYTLDHPVANQNEIALFINFVRQEPTTAYTASGTSLTLTSATSSSDDMYCIYLGKAVQTVNPPSGSVGTAQLADSSVSLAKLSATGTKNSTTFLRGDNTFAEAGGGKINQVLNSVATVNTSSSSDVELFNLSITPSSTSSKILAIVNVTAQLDANEYTSFDLYRGTLSSGTKVYDAGETLFNSADSTRLGYGFTYLDSPSTTSATQYTVVGSPHFGTITFGATGKNTITLIEVLV